MSEAPENASSSSDVPALAPLDDRLQAFVGRGGNVFEKARDAITVEAIRQMTDVCGDRNPVYGDPQFAAKAVHGGIVAPPTSILAWWVRNFEPASSSDRVDADGVRRFRLDPNPARQIAQQALRPAVSLPFDELLRALEGAGYSSVAVTNGEYRLLRYLRVGDHLSYSDHKIEAITGPKRTSLGEGYFITLCQTVLDAGGELVGEMRTTSICFKPPTAQS